MADEGFHEIHLNGKQLVFLFMAATVVSVVIFLCGVMVGRGVRLPAAAAAAASIPADPTASVRNASPSAITAERLPVSTQEALTYSERLEAPVPPPETLREEPVIPSSDPVGDSAVADRSPTEREAQRAARTAPASPPGLAEPAGIGFVVQVGAYPNRNTADAIASGLAAKGYPTFVTPRLGLFAVRVGKYSEQREAEAVASRLEQIEQFKKPWVTR